MPNKTTGPNLLDPDYWSNTIKMSLSKFFILCVLNHRSMHGYDIARAVDRRTSGSCCPTEGTIYPVLKQFESGGYVTCEKEIVSGRERKVYSITDKGRQAFVIAFNEWSEMSKRLEECRPLAETCCEAISNTG